MNGSSFNLSYCDRVSQLSTQLHSLNFQNSPRGRSKLESLESLLSKLEKSTTEFQDSEFSTLLSLREKLKKLQTLVEEEKSQRDLIFEEKASQLEEIQANLQQRLHYEITSRSETDSTIMRLFDDRVANIRAYISETVREREKQLDSFNSEVRKVFPRVEEKARELIQNSLNFDSEVGKEIAEKLEVLNVEVFEDRKAAGETQEAFISILKDAMGKLRTEIDGERRARELTEDSLLHLLEETSSKLQHKRDLSLQWTVLELLQLFQQDEITLICVNSFLAGIKGNFVSLN